MVKVNHDMYIFFVPISCSFTFTDVSNFAIYLGITSGVRRTINDRAVTPPLVLAVISAPYSISRKAQLLKKKIFTHLGNINN